jgi:NAD-dependent dihydropyrimidine dehydrogenase PreA subunit
VIRTSGVADLVDHREIILPQLCATGVERRQITDATGFATRWGPARLEDLPAFLDRGCHAHRGDRTMRFPLWERMEMAVMWGAPVLAIGSLVVVPWAGLRVLAAAALAVVTVVAGIFGFLPWLRVGPGWRWVTFAFFVALGFGASAGLLVLLGSLTTTSLAIIAGGSLIAGLILAADLEGTTPWYGSFINTFHNEAHIEIVADRCTGAADCIQVCPREVLQMDGRERRAIVDRPGQCIQCGACIVQCPEDALRFRYDDGRVVEAPTIRRTRMNMLGRRTVEVADGPTIAG